VPADDPFNVTDTDGTTSFVALFLTVPKYWVVCANVLKVLNKVTTKDIVVFSI